MESHGPQALLVSNSSCGIAPPFWHGSPFSCGLFVNSLGSISLGTLIALPCHANMIEPIGVLERGDSQAGLKWRNKPKKK